MRRDLTRSSHHRAAWIAVIAVIASIGPTARACGPYGVGAAFWYDHQPGPPLPAFLEGQLGILDRELDAAYLYVAYRHLRGLDMGEANRRALASLWEPAAADGPVNGLVAWREARERVPGLAPLGWLNTSRSRETSDDGSVFYAYFLNCLDDALLTAAETLTARVERFGASSREVRTWVEAQDQVFSNCSAGETIPPALEAAWDPLIRADRAYQVAAAHFYATHYSRAEEHFRAIARDASSPWQHLSAYLVARAQIRDGRYAAAARELRALLDDPARAAMHEPAERLLAFCSLRADPDGRRRELAERLLPAELEAPLTQTFIDYSWVLDHSSSEGDGLGAWLRVVTPDGEGVGGSPVAGNRWRREQSEVWLVAALLTAGADTPGLDGLLAAAADVPEGSPAHLTAAFHRARLLVATGRAEAARAVLDPLLAADPETQSASDRNRLRLLRAEITPDLHEYLRLVAMPPLRLGYDDGTGHLLFSLGQPDSVYPYYRLEQPMLPDTAVELLNHGLSTEEMLRLSESEVLPDPWPRRLALATWTRAVVTGDHVLALEASEVVQRLAPELAEEMEAFVAAHPGDRAFAAAWTMLRFPGLTPVVRWGVGRRTPIDERDSLRDNGWCAGVLEVESVPGQIVRSAEQVAALQASRPARLPGSPDDLGRTVLARCENHLDDPRLPEALHLVVQATRYGCGFEGYAEVSKAAFRKLHDEFPTSPWTAKTPYWFD